MHDAVGAMQVINESSRRIADIIGVIDAIALLQPGCKDQGGKKLTFLCHLRLGTLGVPASIGSTTRQSAPIDGVDEGIC